MRDDTLLSVSFASDYGTVSLPLASEQDCNHSCSWLQTSRALRSFKDQVRVFELREVPTSTSIPAEEEIRNHLVWFLRHHPHLREVKLSFWNPHGRQQQQPHDIITNNTGMVDEMLMALTENASARLESLQVDMAPSSSKILASLLVKKSRSLKLLSLVHPITGHITTANEQILAQFLDDEDDNNNKGDDDSSFTCNRVLVSTPSQHLSLVLRSLARIETLQTVNLFAKHDVDAVMEAARHFLAAGLKRNNDNTRRRKRHRWLSSFHLHNHSPRTRHAAVVSNQFWQTILTEEHSLQSLMLSGYTIPCNMDLERGWQQPNQTAASLTELHLCQCQVEETMLLNLAGSLSQLKILRLQRIESDSERLSAFLQHWRKSSSSFFRSLSTLDLFGTKLDATAMNSLCALLISSSSCLTKISSLSLGNQWTSRNVLSEDAILAFVKRLVDMKNLTSLHLSHNVSTVTVAQAFVCAVGKIHSSLRTLEGLKWVVAVTEDDMDDDLRDCRQQSEFYIKWNQRGRCLLQRSVPCSLWAVILSHPSGKGEVDVMYSFLRSGSAGPLACLKGACDV